MSDIWMRRRRFGNAQCSIAEAASARNISANIFACTVYCRGFITDERSEKYRMRTGGFIYPRGSGLQSKRLVYRSYPDKEL
ncbi:hypothetical protein EVAR_14592_1 [Eumeta japonica]|uniref:Uncharacterized protein n=1 Tax=Eumeta variegata TaxID=151549 RepID=A0A4C1UW98_EUMVA|nr:hypothetical protein EVAR_14592_1 [Eumeta japonica]